MSAVFLLVVGIINISPSRVRDAHPHPPIDPSALGEFACKGLSTCGFHRLDTSQPLCERREFWIEGFRELEEEATQGDGESLRSASFPESRTDPFLRTRPSTASRRFTSQKKFAGRSRLLRCWDQPTRCSTRFAFRQSLSHRNHRRFTEFTHPGHLSVASAGHTEKTIHGDVGPSIQKEMASSLITLIYFCMKFKQTSFPLLRTATCIPAIVPRPAPRKGMPCSAVWRRVDGRERPKLQGIL